MCYLIDSFNQHRVQKYFKLKLPKKGYSNLIPLINYTRKKSSTSSCPPQDLKYLVTEYTHDPQCNLHENRYFFRVFVQMQRFETNPQFSYEKC